MIRQVSVINPDIKHLIHRADSYIDQDGCHPAINSVIPADEIINGQWKIAVKDPDLFKKLQGQIYFFMLGSEFVYILE